MSTTKLIQYIHRPNTTELGMGNTHETYMLISSNLDISEIFPISKEVDIESVFTGKRYKLKSAYGREFRVNQMGDIYRDFGVFPGDEIVVTKIEKENASKICLVVKTYQRVVFIVNSNGSEVINMDRLIPFSTGVKQFAIDTYDGENVNPLNISFKESKKKRTDSPDVTDFYNVTLNKTPLSNGTYYLTLSDKSTLVALEKCEFNVIEYNDIMFSDIDVDNNSDSQNEDNIKSDDNLPLQQIYYGAPGTGKSFSVDDICKSFVHYRTTFHPDSDYSTFVGCYKPQNVSGERIFDKMELKNKLNIIKNSGVSYPCQKFATKYWQSLKLLLPGDIKEILTECEFTDSMSSEILKGIGIGEELMPDQYNSRIVYQFSPQVFTRAYVEAWKKQEKGEKVYLVIEEINRGNCAQIFGDLFQLLDRDENGFSKYEIVPDTDLMQYLKSQSLNAKDVLDSDGNDISLAINSGELMKLPNNLYIWATMNTSDQSLFPIDSAFKRRWDWKYVPIKYTNTHWRIVLGDKKYSWVVFQEKINDKIKDATDGSEDKLLGDFFVKAKNNVIDEDLLLNKIAFYLWNDVCKDGEGDIFKIKNGDKTEDISFSQFFKEDSILKLQQWMDYLKVDPYSDPNNNVSVQNQENIEFANDEIN